MALPALLGGAGRALATTSRVAKAANIGTKFLGKDTKKKKPGMGTERESSSLTIRPSTSMVPAKFSTTFGLFSSTPKTSTSGGDSLEENVAYIRKKTVEIDKLLKESFKLRKKEAKDAQKMRSALARKEKEGRFESGAKGVAANVAKKEGKPFSSIFDAIKNYITSILVGFIAIKLLPLLPKMLELLKVVGPAMDFILGIAGKLLDGLVTFVDWGYKAYDATRGFIKGVGGEGAAKAFDKFSSAMNTMINLALILAMANAVGGGFGGGRGGRRGGRRGGSTRPTTRPGVGGRPKVTTTGGRGVNRPDFRNPFRQRPNVTGSGSGPFSGFRNPFRQGPRITGSGTGGFRFTNPFKGAKFPQLPKGSGTGIFSKINPKSIASGAKGFGIGLAIESIAQFGLDWTFDRLFGTRQEQNEKFLERQAQRSSSEKQEVIDKLLKAYKKEKEYQNSPLGKLDKIISLGGDTTSDVQLRVITDRLNALGITPPAMQTGGKVGDDDKDQKRTLNQSQILPVLQTPDLGISDIGKNIGGPKAVDRLYKQEGVQNLIRLYNEVKRVPIYGEAMATAIGMALGNTPSSRSYLSMGSTLINFSNLQASENISKSTATISQTAQKFETGGQVFVSKVSLSDSIQDTTNVANYLRTQISSIKVKPEEKTPEGIARILEMIGIKTGDYEMQQGGESPSSSSSSSPSSSSPTISSPSTSNNSGLTPQQRAFLETISYAEGTKQRGYNTWFGNQLFPKDQPDLSKYTINQIVELQKRFNREGRGRFAGGTSAAVGKYQMTYPETFAAAAGLDPAVDKFTPANQDKMALYGYVMKQGGVTQAEINAPEMSDQTIDKLAPVFASFPNLFGPGQGGKAPGDGVSYYPSQGAKFKADIKARFKKERGLAIESAKSTPVSPTQPKSQGGGLLDPVLNMLGMGSQQQGQGEPKGLIGSVVQWLHGNPNRKGYDAGHAGMSNAHDHFSFTSRTAAVSAFKALKKAGYAPYEFEGFTSVGNHSPRGGHFGSVGQPPTYNDKTDGTAFDIPWSSYGSGPIGQKDYDKSYKAAQIVGAAQGGGPVPGAFRELQETMGYDKSKTRVLIQPMIVEKEVPMPMPSGGGGGIMVMGGEVNNTTDSLAAG